MITLSSYFHSSYIKHFPIKVCKFFKSKDTLINRQTKFHEN